MKRKFTETDLQWFGMTARELMRSGYTVYKNPIKKHGSPHMGFAKDGVMYVAALIPRWKFCPALIGFGMFDPRDQNTPIPVWIIAAEPIPLDAPISEGLPKRFHDAIARLENQVHTELPEIDLRLLDEAALTQHKQVPPLTGWPRPLNNNIAIVPGTGSGKVFNR